MARSVRSIRLKVGQRLELRQLGERHPVLDAWRLVEKQRVARGARHAGARRDVET